ncbi:MAG: hypothetical protein IKP73_04520 [Bacteroidales bacterium]|jgi:hypothetical protein|nr:hypothetical protein [Bacteroidales bacterium]
METDFISIFQSLAYPVAVSAILFWAIWHIGKQTVENINKRETEYAKIQQQHIAYMQAQNLELMGAIKENTLTFRELISALNRFSKVLESLEKKLIIKTPAQNETH